MKIVSLKIEENIFLETEKILSSISTSRNKYINEAIKYYNTEQKRQILSKKLQTESELVRKDSMIALNDFEKIDYAD